jgi:hypothetical protein
MIRLQQVGVRLTGDALPRYEPLRKNTWRPNFATSKMTLAEALANSRLRWIELKNKGRSGPRAAPPA